MHVAALDDDPSLGVVDLDEVVRVGLDHLGLAAGAAQQRLHAREQLLSPERLRDVVVGAGREASHLLELLRTRRQHQHRHVREVADPLERLVAVHVGHRHVEDHERRRRREELSKRGPSVARLVDRVARALEQLPQQQADVVVVVDDEDSEAGAFIPASYHPDREIPASSDDSAPVARVLICEPHDDISALLELVVRRLGHEPVDSTRDGPARSRVDAAVIEPGRRHGLDRAQTLRERDVPVLFTSIYPADKDVLALAAGRVPRQAVPAVRARAGARRRALALVRPRRAAAA